MLSEGHDLNETAKVHLTLATCLMFLEALIEEPEGKEINRLKVVNYLSRAIDVFESIGDAYLLGFSHLFLGAHTGEEESVRHFEKVLEYGEETRDNLLLASGHSLWSGPGGLPADRWRPPALRAVHGLSPRRATGREARPCALRVPSKHETVPGLSSVPRTGRLLRRAPARALRTAGPKGSRHLPARLRSDAFRTPGMLRRMVADIADARAW